MKLYKVWLNGNNPSVFNVLNILRINSEWKLLTSCSNKENSYLTEDNGYPEDVRLIAANYIYRAKDLSKLFN